MKTKQKQWGKILAVFVVIGGALFAAPSSYAALTDGLVANWTFDDCTANDNSGNGHNGSLKGTTCSVGVINKSLSFNGSGDYVEVPDAPDLSPAKAITVSAWVKPNDFYAGECKANYIVNKGQQILAPGFFALSYYDPAIVTGGCFANSGKHVFSFTTTFSDGTWGQGQGLIDGTQDIVLGKWYLVTATYDGVNAKLYVNGKLDAQKRVGKSLGANTENLRIGSLNFARWPYWVNGGIDDVRIYNRALTATEVTSLYLLSNPIQGAVNWNTIHTVTCQNITQNTSVVIPKTKVAAWDCEKAGLPVNHGDKVKVTIDGTKY